MKREKDFALEAHVAYFFKAWDSEVFTGENKTFLRIFFALFFSYWGRDNRGCTLRAFVGQVHPPASPSSPPPKKKILNIALVHPRTKIRPTRSSQHHDLTRFRVIYSGTRVEFRVLQALSEQPKHT